MSFFDLFSTPLDGETGTPPRPRPDPPPRPRPDTRPRPGPSSIYTATIETTDESRTAYLLGTFAP